MKRSSRYQPKKPSIEKTFTDGEGFMNTKNFSYFFNEISDLEKTKVLKEVIRRANQDQLKSYQSYQTVITAE